MRRKTTAGVSPTAVPMWLMGPFALLLLLHGLVHLMGVALTWKLGEPGALRYEDVTLEPGSLPALALGVGWLVATALFVVGAFAALRHWVTAPVVWFAGAVVSLPVVAATVPSSAQAGVGVNVVVAAVAGWWLFRDVEAPVSRGGAA